MANIDEIKKAISAPDTEEFIRLVEALDSDSQVLVKTYMSALADKQQLEKSKLAV